MPTYSTPGVYVEEESLLPPSIAAVSTAIPAFIGYTEKIEKGTESLVATPVRISSLLEYEETFGGPQIVELTVKVDTDETLTVEEPTVLFQMYYSLELYFRNGGGPCYVVSAGPYKDAPDGPDKVEMRDALTVLDEADEPTLIVLVDAVNLPVIDYYDLCNAALDHCGDTLNRFCILDVLQDEGVEKFRNGITSAALKHGAAYYPNLKTTLTHAYDESKVIVEGVTFNDSTAEYETDKNGIRVSHAEDSKTFKIVELDQADVTFGEESGELTITVPLGGVKSSLVFKAWVAWAGPKEGFSIQRAGTGSALATAMSSQALTKAEDAGTNKLSDFKYDKTALYSNIKLALATKRIVLPPSAAMAGQYAKTDRNIGVWKAPANISLSSVIEPAKRMSDETQAGYNIDPQAGKSVNVIRYFTGKGSIVWGARTMAGNDAEWRYINVRRLFSFIEESIEKSTAFAVFEPNSPVTWLKVQGAISAFLEGLWNDGGLVGGSAEDAFFVNVGLDISMSAQDILDGRLKVNVGIAASRPAEFVILTFSHKLQSA